MNIILLSGGAGKRLWPLSNEVRSKQFLKIYKRPDGSYESMVQRTYRMINEFNHDVSVIFATSKDQVYSLNAQLGDSIDISAEPCRKDTFPAVALSVAYLHDVKGISENEVAVVCPVDSYVEASYFTELQNLASLAEKGNAKLFLMGIVPKSPSEKYGYIIPSGKENPSFVKSFKEKPDTETAAAYITEGALWNAGVFAFKIKYVLERAKELLGTSSYEKLLEKYESFPKISFDYAVVEHESDIRVLRHDGKWNDLGTWKSLAGFMSGQDNDVNISSYESITVESGDCISYQGHKHYLELWTILEGNGSINLGGEICTISSGDTVSIKPGIVHDICADSIMHIVQVTID